jgi:hypothetical protein
MMTPEQRRAHIRERYHSDPEFREYVLTEGKRYIAKVRGTKLYRERRLRNQRKWLNQPGKRERMRELVRTWESAHRDVVNAHHAVKYALRVGKLVRPECCSKCGDKPFPRSDGLSRLQAHHHNGYAKEHRLDVVWLCAYCHRQERGK